MKVLIEVAGRLFIFGVLWLVCYGWELTLFYSMTLAAALAPFLLLVWFVCFALILFFQFGELFTKNTSNR